MFKYQSLLPAILLALPSTLLADDAIESLKKSADAQLLQANTEIVFKKVELGKKYVAALDSLEKSLRESGKLDAIVHLREERDLINKSGGTTSYTDKELVDLRDKYFKGIEAIDNTLLPVQSKIAAEVSAKTRTMVTDLTKAGKIEEAVKLRKEADQMLLDLGISAAKDTASQEAPNKAGNPGSKAPESLKVSAPLTQANVAIYPYCSIASGEKLDPKTKGIFDELSVKATAGKEFRVRISGKKRNEVGYLKETPALHTGKLFIIPIAEHKGIIEVDLPSATDVRTYYLSLEFSDNKIKTVDLVLDKGNYNWQIRKEGDKIVYDVYQGERKVGSIQGDADRVTGFGLSATVRWKGNEANIAMTVE